MNRAGARELFFDHLQSVFLRHKTVEVSPWQFPDPGMNFPLPNFATALGAALGTTFAFYPCHFSFCPRGFPWNEKRSGHVPMSLCPDLSRPRDRFGGCQRMLAQGAELCHQPGCSSMAEPHPIPQTCHRDGAPLPSLLLGKAGMCLTILYVFFLTFSFFSWLFFSPPHPASPLQQPRFSPLCWVPVR